MTFPTLKSEKSSKRSNSRSRSRSRSNRKRTRKNRRRNRRNKYNNNHNNDREIDHNHNHNKNRNQNQHQNKMEIDSNSDESMANNPILSSPINKLNLSSSSLLSCSSSSSSSSSSLSISSISTSSPSEASSNIVRGKNRKFKARKRRRNRNKNKNKQKDKDKHCEQSEDERQEQEPMNLDQDQVRDEVLSENEELKEDIMDTEKATPREEERREFRFNIEDDSNLRDILSNNVTRDNLSEYGFTMPIHTNNNNHNNVATMNIDNNTTDNATNTNELTSEYILSKLYNYMKISEMSKYGISVFEMTFTSYLPYLSESDLIKLATSYWCNGQHFNCMISHRGDIIKSKQSKSYQNDSYSHSNLSSYYFQDDDHDENVNEDDTEKDNDKSKERLELVITADLLDAAMQSGASVDKIEAMLLQKRIDDGINNNNNKKLKKKTISKDGRLLFYQTKYEKNFYLRNLKHRFWNHEVLVRVFIQNGWLTPNLAEIAMKTFIKTIYHRVLQSKMSQYNYNNKNNFHRNHRRNSPHKNNGNNGNKNVKFSENFLHSFFVSYFCLDDIPKMYRNEIKQKMRNGNNNKYLSSSIISCETLRRWCELIELLASRGANINESQFKKVIPLQYALQLGKNTYKIISATHSKKNQLFIPDSFHQENISVPNDIWDVMVSYL